MRTNLLDVVGVIRTVGGMPNDITRTVSAPSDYLEHFGYDEFKFRWLDALGLERDDWRRGTELFTAYVLSSFMDVQGACYPSIERLATPMCKSEDTVRRALRKLATHGWLMIVPRANRTNQYFAVLPAYGMQLLLDQRATGHSGTAGAELHAAVARVLAVACDAHGFDQAQLMQERSWARIEGRLYQVINRLGGPNTDLSSLMRWMSDEASDGVSSPVGFLLARASSFAKAYRNAAGTKVQQGEDNDLNAVQETLFELTRLFDAKKTSQL